MKLQAAPVFDRAGPGPILRIPAAHVPALSDAPSPPPPQSHRSLSPTYSLGSLLSRLPDPARSKKFESRRTGWALLQSSRDVRM